MVREDTTLPNTNPTQRQKVAIPRLNQAPPLYSPEANEKTMTERVSRACKTCRKRKVRCSGELPTCKNCLASQSDCVYEQARRDRLKEATDLNFTLATLLRSLGERVDQKDKQQIDDVLSNIEDDMMSHATIIPATSLGKRKQAAQEDDRGSVTHGEANVAGSTGSNENLDHLDEDLLRNRESRETGYVGQNSAVQWLRSAQRQAENSGEEPRTPLSGPPGSSQPAIRARSHALHLRRDDAKKTSRQGSMRHATDTSFYLDSTSLDVDFIIDPFELPPLEIAENLFKCYMRTVHSSFPLLPSTFEDQFYRYIDSLRRHEPYLVPEKWRAQLNLVFAIGAKYSHLIDADWRGHENDHLLYMTKAVHLLGVKDTVMLISGPDLDLVQATAMLSFYFLIIGHVSRAWVMIGISTRLALALGLHLRNEDPGAEQSKKTMLAHIWWALNSIECLLNIITGRPTVIAAEDCTVPIPDSASDLRKNSGASKKSALGRESSQETPQTSGPSNRAEAGKHTSLPDRYHIDHINISLLSQKALSQLYSPRTATRSWELIQSNMAKLLIELEDWRTATLLDYPIDTVDDAKLSRGRFFLESDYWSTRMLISRPCLCRLKRRIVDQSDKSAQFDAESAETCVNAALGMIKLFPDQPDLEFIYGKGPWWAMVHFIMQSMAVLLIELGYRSQELKKGDRSLMLPIKKMIRWLQAMQENDPVAARACEVIWEILKTCAPSLQAEARDLLAAEIPRPSAESSRSQNTPAQQPSQPQVPGETYEDSTMVDENTDYMFNQNYLFNQPYGYQANTLPHFVQQTPFPMPFSNPFFTSFDQITPVGDVQNLWAEARFFTEPEPEPSGAFPAQNSQTVPSGSQVAPQDPQIVSLGQNLDYYEQEEYTSQEREYSQ